MKYQILITILLGSSALFAQPLSSTGDTYAVVVGISDYQDEDIPDLKFADKDALAFAGFLQSPAGGSLDEDHLKVLVNEQATVARFAIALDWLWEVVKENDKVIIYFSGHGDVERKSLTQPGFLLCWDAPSKVYMAGGAFALPMLQEVISTLSIQNKAKVIVITDACRSGKLSGSSVGGSQLTSNNLAKQYANEIKILSCQPNEYSIEGEQWGGGRGAFSYHLLEGLYGMADGNEDLIVNLKEIDRYLEDHVSLEVAPQSQNPMTIGSKMERLTFVNPEILAELKEGKKREMKLFAATESRGIESDVLAATDSNTVQMYFAFQKALEDKQFLFAEAGRDKNDYAEFYYEKLSKEPQLKKLYSSMRRNYAAALQDDAQQVMNGWLKNESEADRNIERIPKKVFSDKVKAFPACIQRAADLLGKEHYMYAILQARKHFFEGYIIANSNKNPNPEIGNRALEQFRKALQFEPEMPHAYWQMIDVFGYNFLQPDSAAYYAQKVIDIYPFWLKPYTEVAFLFSFKHKDFDRARIYLEMAEKVDSNAVAVWKAWGDYYAEQKMYTESEKYFKRAIELDSTNCTYYTSLGVDYLIQKKYEEAERYFKKAIQLDSTYSFAYYNLGCHYYATQRYGEAEKYLKKTIQLDSTYSLAYGSLGNVYHATGRYEEGGKYFKKTIQLDSTLTYAYNGLGWFYAESHRFDEAEKYYKKAVQLDSTHWPVWVNLGGFYLNTNQPEKAEAAYLKALQLNITNPFFHSWVYDGLGSLDLQNQRFGEAEERFKKALELNPGFTDAHNHLGLLYIRTGRFDEAKSSLDKTLELDPDDSTAPVYLAQWSLKNKQTEKAWEYLEQGLGKGYNEFEDLQSESDFEEMRKDLRWEELIKQYFPEQSK